MIMLQTYGKQDPTENPYRNDWTKYVFNKIGTRFEINKLKKMLLHLEGLKGVNFYSINQEMKDFLPNHPWHAKYIECQAQRLNYNSMMPDHPDET